MQCKTDEELYLILRVHAQKHTPEAIKAASEEFHHRQLDEPTISRIMAVADKALEEKSRNLGTEPMPMSDFKETARLLGWLVLFCFVGYAIYGGYKWFDSIGWIPHSYVTPVWMEGDWMVGEYRYCHMLRTVSYTVTGGGDESPRLLCDTEHNGLGAFVQAVSPVDHDVALKLASKMNPANSSDWAELDKYFHILPVRYFGEIDDPGFQADQWRCQRMSESLDCKVRR